MSGRDVIRIGRPPRGPRRHTWFDAMAGHLFIALGLTAIALNLAMHVTIIGSAL